MILFASVIVVGFLIGFLARGRLSGFEHVRIEWWGLAIAGLAVQFIPLPEGPNGTDLLVRTIVLAVSYALLLTCAARNVRMPGMPLILLGLVLNAAVIITNGGMPVSEQALRTSGQDAVLADLQDAGADKHHLEDDGDVLRPLGDVIGVPPPVSQAISVGDVIVYLGLIWFVVSVMRGRSQPSNPSGPGYQGRHRPDRPPEQTPSRPDLPLPAATTSGTER